MHGQPCTIFVCKKEHLPLEFQSLLRSDTKATKIFQVQQSEVKVTKLAEETRLGENGVPIRCYCVIWEMLATIFFRAISVVWIEVEEIQASEETQIMFANQAELMGKQDDPGGNGGYCKLSRDQRGSCRGSSPAPRFFKSN